jgi:hypothetical protein
MIIGFKMWNLKTLKIQKMFQNCFKFSELQKSFTTYKWVIMYMMYEGKLYLKVYKTKEFEILISGDDFEF